MTVTLVNLFRYVEQTALGPAEHLWKVELAGKGRHYPVTFAQAAPTVHRRPGALVERQRVEKGQNY